MAARTGRVLHCKKFQRGTSMAYLYDTAVWGSVQPEVFLMLPRAGRDSSEPSNDGTIGATCSVTRANGREPLRAALIAALDADIQTIRPGIFSRFVCASKPIAWSAALAH